MPNWNEKWNAAMKESKKTTAASINSFSLRWNSLLLIPPFSEVFKGDGGVEINRSPNYVEGECLFYWLAVH